VKDDSRTVTHLPAHAAPEAPPRAAPGSRSWFDRLHVKLFLAIAGANALLAVAAYLFFSWTFDRGFVEYLNRADQARLDALVGTLAAGYGRERSWDWLVNDRNRWSDLVRDALGLPRSSRRAPGEASTPQPPAPAAPARELPLTIDPRLFLFDADRQLLIGRPDFASQAILKPIIWQDSLAGHLGYIPRPQYVEAFDRIFSERQRRKFAAVALGMLGAALLLGAGLAHWLTRRTRAVARGTGALIQGHYDVRLAASGDDELAQLARDFNRLAATLSATRDARRQWIADIAHELRTPLAVLRGEIEALQDGVRPLGQASLGSLAQEVAQLARLVEDLHLLSLSDLGALSHRREPLDVGELVEEAVDGQRRALEARGLDVELKIERGATILGDGARLAQVFGNLLQNTLRYTDSPGRLAVAVRRAGSRVVVDWQDSSPGVPDADLPRLVERLYRVDASRSREGGGSGLGLAIVRAIVDAHEGTLAARASSLGGLWWEISFPALAARAADG
jgi:two-component system sensor histidine kinase BaeS